ncbi:MAG: hypothetical protein JXC32_07150 [Anaerolineae bacterium]|nr:hypothetical protein [Anaerolineae bacterium]
MADTRTYDEAIGEVLAELDSAIPMDEFVARVLALRPSTAKRPRSIVTNQLRSYWHSQVAHLKGDMLIPTRLVMHGVRYRVYLDRLQVSRGGLISDTLLLGYVRPLYLWGFRREDHVVQLEDHTGQPIPTKIVTWKQQVQGLFDHQTLERPAFDLRAWFQAQGVRRDDAIVITVLDWQEPRIRLEVERAKVRARRQAEIEAANAALTEALYEQLEAAHSEGIRVDEALGAAVASLPQLTEASCPKDHWLTLVDRDPRMTTDGSMIRYSDFRSPFMRMLEDAGAIAPVDKGLVEITREAAHHVYRFRASFAGNDTLWREIEILGGQTLGQLDVWLRDAFNHDPADRLSGFWLWKRRGRTNRYRQVELGTVDPLGGGDAADIKVAALGLEVNAQLRYVYDFGDWVEHTLTLQSISSPDEGVKYPRIAGQNRPRYRYCSQCKREGRKTVATWKTVSYDEEGRARTQYLCDECIDEVGCDDWAEEIVY